MANMFVLRVAFVPMVPGGRGGTPNKLVPVVSFMATASRRGVAMEELFFQVEDLSTPGARCDGGVDKGPQGYSASHVN